MVDGGVFGVMECLMKDKSSGGAPGVPVLMPGCFHSKLVLYLAPESLLEAVETDFSGTGVLSIRHTDDDIDMIRTCYLIRSILISIAL